MSASDPLGKMHHYPGDAVSAPYVVTSGHHPYGPVAPAPPPPPGIEIAAPIPPPPHSMHVYHHSYAGHPHAHAAYQSAAAVAAAAQNSPYHAQLGHQYPPGYGPPPPAYHSPPSAPPALYADGRLGYASTGIPPPMSSNLYANPTPVVVYTNQPPPQQGYYSSMLNSPLPSPHQMTSPRPYMSGQTSSVCIRPSPIPSPVHHGLRSPIALQADRSSVVSIKSPTSAFQPMKSPNHRSPHHTPPSQQVSPWSSPPPSMTSPVAKPPADASSTGALSNGSQANGPLRSLEKMLMHSENHSSADVDPSGSDGKDTIDCKLDILERNPTVIFTAARQRASSYSGDEVKPNISPEQRDGASFCRPNKDTSPMKRGRPVGSKNRNKRAGIVLDSKILIKRKKSKESLAPIPKHELQKTSLKDKEIDRHERGPRIRMDASKNCTVVNSLSSFDDKEAKAPVKESIHISRAENVKLTDAPWVCCFCGWGSTHGLLGDLFGPYQIEGFRPPKRTTPTKKCRKRRDSRHSEEETVETTFRRSSGDLCASGEAWVHEECATWAEGVYMVGYKLQGLEESARFARQTLCSVCKVHGATIGCLHKGCQQKYHYPCAMNKNCLLNEENLSSVCHKHKDKKIKMIGSFSPR